MTFATLRALQAIIAEGIDDIERIYASSTGQADKASAGLDFPSLDVPGDADSRAEKLTSDPAVLTAIARIVSASEQLATAVRSPFLTLCNATMGLGCCSLFLPQYHLPACVRFLEAAHIPELLRDAGLDGTSAAEIARRVGVDASTTSHILRLLATHHILRETRPDRFALNRVSALLDSGKTFDALSTRHEWKYDGQGQKAAFFALNSDELFKASAYLTDMILPHAVTDDAAVRAAPLERLTNGLSNLKTSTSAPCDTTTTDTIITTTLLATRSPVPSHAAGGDDADARTPESPLAAFNLSQRTATPYWAWLEAPGNEARLARFGCAMGGSQGWEEVALEALGDHPFPDLPPSSVVVDVGGGIGNTTMRLARRFPELKFIVQDRAPVCKLGEEAWRARSSDLLASGRVRFQAHDFFTPQPVHAPAVFLVRVVCHDWPDALARRILRQLRRAAGPATRLVLGEHILPYAVAGSRDDVVAGARDDAVGGARDDAVLVARDGDGDGGVFDDDEDTPALTRDASPEPESEPELAHIEGASDVQRLRGARWPLLANLGTASANAYYMDLTMKTIFDGKERTLPEHVALAASAGWRVVRVSGIEGSLFGHIVAEPEGVSSEW